MTFKAFFKIKHILPVYSSAASISTAFKRAAFKRVTSVATNSISQVAFPAVAIPAGSRLAVALPESSTLADAIPAASILAIDLLANSIVAATISVSFAAGSAHAGPAGSAHAGPALSEAAHATATTHARAIHSKATHSGDKLSPNHHEPHSESALETPSEAEPDSAAVTDEIVLAPGHSYDLSLPPKATVSISNGSLVSAREKEGGNVIRITGKKLGETELRISMVKLLPQRAPQPETAPKSQIEPKSHTAALQPQHKLQAQLELHPRQANLPQLENESKNQTRLLRVSVVPTELYNSYNRLKLILIKKRGLQLNLIHGNLEVTGTILRWSDWREIAVAMNDHRPGYSMKARLDKSVLNQAQKCFPELLAAAGLPDISLRFEPSPSASLPSEPADLAEQVARALGPYGFRIDKSPSTISLEPLVRVSITVAEVRSKFANNLGLKWPTSVEAQLLPNPALSADGQLKLGLSALEEKGLGKILASPNLLCRSGRSAQFLAGGEIPIRIVNFKTQDIIWKKHGVLLKVSPTADYAGHLSIAIETEVSMIDEAHTVDGVPGLLTNRVESHFDLTRSRTVVLSGLLKNEWGKSQSGLAGLASLPVIGPLFSSRDFRESRSELMIFVTPEVLAANSPDSISPPSFEELGKGLK